MPNNKEDMLRLIEFTLKHRKDPIITMSMGEIGLPTRIFNPILGSLITYGYINTPSAPGQLSIREISQIFKMLKVR
jgi:3-dehydroquinate dehydratase type I